MELSWVFVSQIALLMLWGAILTNLVTNNVIDHKKVADAIGGHK
jgi:hypothetical protein